MKVVKEDFLKHKPGFSTKACHGHPDGEKNTREVISPISLSTVHRQTEPGRSGQTDHSRGGNSSRLILESTLGAIEGSKHALCFSSGQSAATTLLFLLNSGDHIVCLDDFHGVAQRIFKKCASTMNITTSSVNTQELDSLVEVIRPTTKMIWIESPTDPLLNIVDIRSVATIAQKFAGVLLVVDNTSLTPYFQKPLELGADISMYSLTKYMNGHSDVVMGAICTNSDDIHRRLQFLQQVLGQMPSPVDCYQVIRSLKTLSLRMDQHMKSALIIGRHLESHAMVERVIHPALPSHPQHALLKKQCYGYGGVFTFSLKGGLQQSKKFLSGLKIITPADGFGGCESLIEIPALMSHHTLPAEQNGAPIPDDLIRLSVGLEDPEDLIQDIEQSLAKTW